MPISITKGKEAPKSQKPTGPVALSSKAATTTTSVQYPTGAEKVTQETPPATSPTLSAPAYVSVSMGVTRNMGNYESIKASVNITLPCEATAEEIEATYESAKGWADSKMTALNAEIDEQLGGS